MALIFLATMAHGRTERELTMKDHRLNPCPDSPNCVFTFSESEKHAIAPYRFKKTLNEAKGAVKQVFSELSRTELVQEGEIFLHYEVRSFLFRFVDDVEILFDDAAKTIHFRSASRVGYSDFGVNRERMEKVRSLLEGRL
ncbi:DUF1499 domain-containing protein [Candidatus Nitrospira allomarina]|uniref:DUF1499 domain-containing protein n=1 Tax=Candidatus Nitrospira allomarina TaxID=3020900 RepID=A0AA96G9L1_9BACT|nr:DUF1499 domain-containing protein [Candidatus Nitrospira allomarina]WNM56947.1 DUF1499 domain-containing protein [Candidatus Nitrospira allomarina]